MGIEVMRSEEKENNVSVQSLGSYVGHWHCCVTSQVWNITSCQRQCLNGQ